MELFHTLQGEGFHTGKPAVFVRLAGCDVGCVWCDVKESWDAQKHPDFSESQILNKGDVILLALGGHGFEMLEKSEIIEVKKGPYMGDEDKVRFEQSNSIKKNK